MYIHIFWQEWECCESSIILAGIIATKKKVISSDACVQNSFGTLPKPYNGEENTKSM